MVRQYIRLILPPVQVLFRTCKYLFMHHMQEWYDVGVQQFKLACCKVVIVSMKIGSCVHITYLNSCARRLSRSVHH